jgi:predicted secreted hydrolase
VWLDNWELSSKSPDYFPLTLSTSATDSHLGTIALELSLNSEKPMVLQGDKGFSAKSDTPGNASHYYSYTRLLSTGNIKIGEKTFKVTGSSWLDREWGSSSLDDDQTGWDWFALQFDDNQELMYYRLRTNNSDNNNSENNNQHPSSKGVWVNSDGSTIPLGPDDVKLEPIGHWEYNSTTQYPVHWKLSIPKLDVDITVNAVIDDQLWKSQLRYWEGAMKVSGSHNGRGYLELSGY